MVVIGLYGRSVLNDLCRFLTSPLLVDRLGVGENVVAVVLQGGCGGHHLLSGPQSGCRRVGLDLLCVFAAQHTDTGCAEQNAAKKQTKLSPGIHRNLPP